MKRILYYELILNEIVCLIRGCLWLMLFGRFYGKNYMILMEVRLSSVSPVKEEDDVSISDIVVLEVSFVLRVFDERFVEKRKWFDDGEDGSKESNGEKRFSQVSNSFDMCV